MPSIFLLRVRGKAAPDKPYLGTLHRPLHRRTTNPPPPPNQTRKPFLNLASYVDPLLVIVVGVIDPFGPMVTTAHCTTVSTIPSIQLVSVSDAAENIHLVGASSDGTSSDGETLTALIP